MHGTCAGEVSGVLILQTKFNRFKIFDLRFPMRKTQNTEYMHCESGIINHRAANAIAR